MGRKAKGSKAQNQFILEFLQSGKTLSPMQALHYYGCFRLAARIYDLRQEGYNILSIREVSKTSGKSITRYQMVVK